MTITDVRGLPLTAETSEAAAAYDRALGSFLNYETAAGGEIKAVLKDHPEVVMGSVLRSAMMLMVESAGTQGKVANTAREALSGGDGNDRERRHLSALLHWAAGDPRGAARHWDRILADDPLDLLALKLHHYTTFWTGRAEVLRATVDGVIDRWDESTAGYDHVLGMRAFALNECGRYEDAGRLGREAMDRNPEDLWSVHAVAHSLEMLGDLRAGMDLFDIETIIDTDQWASKNPFRGHLWWHAALFPYSAGRYDQVLAVYDARIEPASTEFYLDIQNRASLLARLELVGIDVGDRWDELGDHAAARIGDHVLTFTDVHCCLALARCGRLDELDRYAGSLADHRRSRHESVDTSDVDVALPMIDGFRLDAAGDHEAAAEQLLRQRNELAPIGGSHAQRDLFDQLTIEVVRKAGDDAMACHLLAARTRRWPNHVPTWTRYADLLAATGRTGPAAEAIARADAIHERDGTR